MRFIRKNGHVIPLRDRVDEAQRKGVIPGKGTNIVRFTAGQRFNTGFSVGGRIGGVSSALGAFAHLAKSRSLGIAAISAGVVGGIAGVAQGIGTGVAYAAIGPRKRRRD